MNILNLIKSTKGRFFKVRFVKRNGETREMACRCGVRKHVKGIGMPYDAASKGLVVVFEPRIKQYRCFATERVTSFRCGAMKWEAA